MNVMDRCNDLVPIANGKVEMTFNGGQYLKAIASIWISPQVENLPLTPLMVAHIGSAQLRNPPKITSQSVSFPVFRHTASSGYDLLLHPHF